MNWVRNNGLSILFGALFLLALGGQAVAGYLAEVEEQSSHGQSRPAFWDFVWSSKFLVAVSENWQSEFLQFFVFIAATIWLVQRGSPESKHPGNEGPQSDEQQMVGGHSADGAASWASARGIRQVVYANSLLIAMGLIFALSWLAQSLTGTAAANAENAQHGEPAISWSEYVVSPDFWARTLENWQSEFLAVGTMIAFSIFLRQRGSSEAKPVGAPQHESAVESE